MTGPRREQLNQAAQIRAMVIAFLNNRPDNAEELSFKEIGEALKDKMEFKPAQLDHVLTNLASANLIKKIKHGRANAYVKLTSTAATSEPAPKAMPATIPGITIDVVKATNRVRLTIQGLIIEIGVVEK